MTRSAASEAIVAAALDDDELPLFVVCGGPLTNVAAALEQEPGIAARMALVWIGGSLDVDAFEYNRDTDPAAADFVFSRPGLVIHQFPLETYRQCAYSVTSWPRTWARVAGSARGSGTATRAPPDWMRARRGMAARRQPARPGDRAGHRVQPVDDGAPGRRSSRCGRPSNGATAHVCTDVDFRLVVGDMLAKLRRHERLAAPRTIGVRRDHDLRDAARAGPGGVQGFYEGLGYRINEHSSDGHTAAVVVDDNIVVRLLTRDSFPVAVGDPSAGPTVVNCLTVEDRPQVDDLVAKALAAGGTSLPAQDDETTYTGSFADPDGHVWQITWMDQLHVVN